VNERPDWIEREVEEANRQHVVVESRTRKSLENSVTFGKKGPKFWQDLVEHLRNNTDNLPSIGLIGETSLVTHPPQGEQYCRVSVHRAGPFPKFTHTDIFYTPGAIAIRSRTPGNHESEYAFRVLSSGEIGAIQCGVDTMPRGATQMAAFIVEGMATLIRH
jgi:hypothetical protein